jgi:hypothetical protein
MIVENAGNQTADQEKGTECQNFFRTQIEQFEPIYSSLNFGSKQNENLNSF